MFACFLLYAAHEICAPAAIEANFVQLVYVYMCYSIIFRDEYFATWTFAH